MERILIGFKVIIIILAFSCINSKNSQKYQKYYYPKELGKDIKIIAQTNYKNYYRLTIYFNTNIGAKYLYIEDKKNHHKVNYEIVSIYGIHLKFLDVDKDGIQDILFDVYIGGKGNRTYKYVIYSSSEKRIYFCEYNYDSKPEIIQKPKTKNKLVLDYLFNLTNWINIDKEGSYFGDN